MQDELFDSNRIDVAKIAARIRTGDKGALPKEIDYKVAQSVIRGMTMHRGELTATDYITRPMLELASHPNFDAEIFEKVARIGAMKNEDIRNLNLEGDSNG